MFIHALTSLTRTDMWMLALAFALRCLLLVYVYPNRERMFNGDSYLYDGLAVHLLDTGDYRYPPADPYSDLVRPPAYPALIAFTYLMTGSRNFLFPVLWNFAGVFALYAGIKTLLEKLKCAPHTFTFFIFAVDWASVLYTKDVATEPVFTPLLVWGIVYFTGALETKRIKDITLSSVLLSLCALMKPIALYMPVPLVVFMLLDHIRRMKRFNFSALMLPTIFVLIFAAGIAPWLVRNKLKHDVWSFTSLQNDNLLFSHAASVYAGEHHLTLKQSQDSLDARLRQTMQPDSQPDSYTGREAAKAKLAKDILFADPAGYAKIILRGAAVTLFDPGRLDFNRTFKLEPIANGFNDTAVRDGLAGTVKRLFERSPVTVALLTAYLIFLVAVMSLAAVGAGPLWKKNKPATLLLLTIIFYLLILGGPNGYLRFRLYLFPFILMFVNEGLNGLKAYIRRRGGKPPSAPSLQATDFSKT
ncbi:MAG: glycosyltransferase family 39 protein [Rhizobacter sp.]|nr:glycosyltransferase family 39 protein [Chlorobiales bacterium]